MPSGGRYRTVLFDLDHTLMDSDASHEAALGAALAALADDRGLSDAQLRADFTRINDALWRRVEGGDVNPNEVKVLRFRQMIEELGVVGDPVEMGEAFANTLMTTGELYDGAFDLLAALGPPSTLGLVTNGIGPVQRGRLARLGIAEMFGAVVISGEAGVSKPWPAIFDFAFSELGVERDRAVMVGDNLGSDIAGGIAAGIDTVWFNQHGADNTSDIEPTHTVGSIDELAELLLISRGR